MTATEQGVRERCYAGRVRHPHNRTKQERVELRVYPDTRHRRRSVDSSKIGRGTEVLIQKTADRSVPSIHAKAVDPGHVESTVRVKVLVPPKDLDASAILRKSATGRCQQKQEDGTDDARHSWLLVGFMKQGRGTKNSRAHPMLAADRSG